MLACGRPVTSVMWQQLRRRLGRTLALLLGIFVATTSFTVLTGSASTSQLRTVGTVSSSARSAYDILVRPKGSTSSLEASRGLVRPNYLSGIFGGISSVQYNQVRRLSGVAVAAPIAMLGYVVPRVSIPLDLSADVHPSGRELFRISRSWVFDRGLSRATDANAFAYVTDARLQTPLVLSSDGAITSEQVGTNSVPVCQSAGLAPASGPFDLGARTSIGCFSRASDANVAPKVVTQWSFPLLIAAIDPAAESQLAGVEQAVISGRYLRPTDNLQPIARGGGSGLAIPVLSPSIPFDDEQLQETVTHLPAAAAQSLLQAPLSPSTAEARFGRTAGTVVQRASVSAADAYHRLLAQLREPATGNSGLINTILTPGPVGYDAQSGGILRARTVQNPSSIWADARFQNGFLPAPLAAADVQFRQLTPHAFTDPTGRSSTPVLRSIGEFDPTKLAGFSALSSVPLETYNPPQAAPGDAAANRALGGHDLLPSGNLGGYLQPPPLMLTTLTALPGLESAFPGLNSSAPISVIRIRVAGVHGLDALSRARVNSVASAIVAATGLDVDITAGSSPEPQTVHLAAGRFGRPPLSLREGWVKKGVAVAILLAVDRKSVLLFTLILIVCSLFIANAAAASVRARRTELGVLAALGWRPGQLFAVLLGELALIGAVAGIAGSLLALPLSSAVGFHPSVMRAALAVPGAVALAVLAGAVPVAQAARAQPVDALQAVSARARRGPAPRGVVGLAITNLTQVPGRTALAGCSVAIGVSALTLILGIVVSFRGTVVGTLLGDAVTVQIRGIDAIAVAVTMLLGAMSVADLLYLNIRERAAEFATLRAVGWPDRSLGFLVTSEGALIGLIGSIAGALLGLALVGAITGQLPSLTILVAGAGVAAGTLLASLAAGIPARLLGRISTAALLADE